MDNTTRALVALYDACPWLDVRNLAGPRNAAKRQEIFSTLTGRKVRRADAGITALADALESAVGAQGGCFAARSDDFKLRAVAALRDAIPGACVLAEVAEYPGQAPEVRACRVAYAEEAAKLAGTRCGMTRTLYRVDQPLPWGTTVEIENGKAVPNAGNEYYTFA